MRVKRSREPAVPASKLQQTYGLPPSDGAGCWSQSAPAPWARAMSANVYMSKHLIIVHRIICFGVVCMAVHGGMIVTL